MSGSVRRVVVLTAGGDTPALNATIYGVVQRANELGIEVIGLIKGFAGMLDPRVPHVKLNPLFNTIPELDPYRGGTILGSSRTYIDANDSTQRETAARHLQALGADGLICIGGDGTLNGMQPLAEILPCILTPKTIDNDLGLNYLGEPSEWRYADGQQTAVRVPGREVIDLDEIINYATPGYATASAVCVQGVQRVRTTAESHRRIAIIEVMGRDSGYLALASAYGQPDIILIPEVPLNYQLLEERVRELYQLQQHVVIVVGEGVQNEAGERLGAARRSYDPAGNVVLSGAAENLADELMQRLGDNFFLSHRHDESVKSAIFTRKIGHTQRGGRPIKFDRYYAAQLGGDSIELLHDRKNNMVATLQWNKQVGFTLQALEGNKLRDSRGVIHARCVHPSLYDAKWFQPSKLGREYLTPVFENAIDSGDLERLRNDSFSKGNLTTRYQSVNIDIQHRIRLL